MSYAAPIVTTCCLCGYDATDWRTVRVGELEAHEACAENTDVYDVVQCPYCGARELADEAVGWTRCSDGQACPSCAADIEPEDAASITAGYAPAGRRNGLIDCLAGILREATE